MRDLAKIVFMLSLVAVVYIYKDSITGFVYDNIIYRNSNKVLTYNEYYLNNDFLFVQNTDSKEVNNYQELLNILYTIINSGESNFTFYCKYDNCINDIKVLTEDENIVSNINNFVHPFNSFSTISIDIKQDKRIAIKLNKLYSDYQIMYIKAYIENFINNNINDSMQDKDKIKLFHDYIINNTEYDQNINTSENSAYNLVKSGKAICGGYSDIMAIYLNFLNIKNYKISSENHIWNLIYLDGKWLHLDMTWDDPVASDGNQYLLHNFFLIDTNELLNLDKVEHSFDYNIYMEAK
ncbi:MAG: transglutaminase domain-containing protein [bacterium]|nr:transglutaminase domain-containing protein [bacterium]